MHRRIYILTSLIIISVIGALAFYFHMNAVSQAYIRQTITNKSAPLCKNCNVILISIDTLSALHLPCYGYERNTAPYLCAFAKNHIWFPNSYAQSYFTLPSHFSIFTSLYPSTHKMLQMKFNTLNPTYKTLAETLQSAGYKTLYFGPTDSEQLPLDRGIGRGFDYIDTTYTYPQVDPALSYWKKGIDMLKSNQLAGKSTFLFLHTYYVHEPYLPLTRNLHFTNDNIPDIPVNSDEFFHITPELIAFVKAYFKQNPLKNTSDANVYQLYTTLLQTADITTATKTLQKLMEIDCPDFCLMPDYYYQKNAQVPRKISYIQALYDENIFRLDNRLKEFLTTLQPLLTENTILIITADHGEAFMEHGKLGHSLLYNEVLRVPLIMSIPHIPAKNVRTPVGGIDIYPTILRFLGLRPTNVLEGADVTGSILGLPFASGRPYIISDLYEMVPSSERKEVPLKQKTIITDTWKLYAKDIEHLTSSNLELYNVQNDPKDTTNVASSHPTVVKNLLWQLEQYMKNRSVVFPDPSYKTNAVPQQKIQQQRYFHY